MTTQRKAQEAERAARKAAADFEAKYPLVAKDVTVRLTPDGWVAFDWVSRTRLYPEIKK